MAESSQLKPLLVAVREQTERRPLDLVSLRGALESLLRFLASPDGRTNENCHAAGSFFMGHDANWDYSDIPEPFGSVLDDMAMQLHDTVSAPDVATRFDSTPEQLLDRVLST